MTNKSPKTNKSPEIFQLKISWNLQIWTTALRGGMGRHPQMKLNDYVSVDEYFQNKKMKRNRI